MSLDSLSPSVIVFDRITFDRLTGDRIPQRFNLSVGFGATEYVTANLYSPSFELLFERVVREFRAADPYEQEIERRVRERLRPRFDPHEFNAGTFRNEFDLSGRSAFERELQRQYGPFIDPDPPKPKKPTPAVKQGATLFEYLLAD